MEKDVKFLDKFTRSVVIFCSIYAVFQLVRTII
nr:MAG TPA_asm: protein of unknown function (DUF3980) [Caudoviricetes sp.]